MPTCSRSGSRPRLEVSQLWSQDSLDLFRNERNTVARRPKTAQVAVERAKAKHEEWKRHFQNRIDRLFIRVRNLVDDLHRQVAYDPVQSFDVIILPSFRTKGMVARDDGRKIRTGTVRSMPGLAHHRFRQKLEWMCRRYGKRRVICNEAYTSRTRSWDGFVNGNLGGAKTVSDGRIVVDRDINGARGIMLRALYGNLGRFRAAGDDVALVAE